MSVQKDVTIKLNNGLEIKIPRYKIASIVLPSLVIRRDYFRLVLEMKNYEEQLKKIKKKFGV